MNFKWQPASQEIIYWLYLQLPNICYCIWQGCIYLFVYFKYCNYTFMTFTGIFVAQKWLSALFSFYPLVQLILGLSPVKNTTTPHLLTSSPIYDLGPFRLNWMLPTPQFSIATQAIHQCHPLFFITHTLRGPTSPNLTDSVAYKCSNKDTQTISVSHGFGYGLKHAQIVATSTQTPASICLFSLTVCLIHCFCFLIGLFLDKFTNTSNCNFKKLSVV